MKEITDYIDVYDATPADKRKAKIAEIAEEMGVPPWEVSGALKAAGCGVSLQWYGQQKRKAEAAAAATQPVMEEPADAAYLKKIIKQQDKLLRQDKEAYVALEARAKDLAGQLHDKDAALADAEAKTRAAEAEVGRLSQEIDGYRAAADDRAALKRSIDFLKDKIRYYQEQIENQNLYINEVDNENATLNEQLDLLLHGAAALKDAAGEAQDAPRPTFEMVPAKEYPSRRVPGGELELADVLNDFCRNLSGVESYLCGRILEALWCWRLNNTADPLRVLGGLVSELIELRLEERENEG